MPVVVPIRAATHPVRIARRTGNIMNTLDFKEKTWEYKIRAIRVIKEIIQFAAIQGAPMEKRARPIMAMVGPMTIGLMIFLTFPMIPEYPRPISTREAIMTAAASSCIWICQTSTPVSFFPATMPMMAKAGPKKEKVPPWIIGSLFPRGDCWIRVQIPEAKNMVEINKAN